MSFQNPFLPWPGPSPWPSGNTITSTTSLSIPTPTGLPTPTITVMPPREETTELFKAWAFGEQLGILKWFKGVGAGIAVALLIASIMCCWAPCVYWYYDGDFSQQDGLDDMTDAILRGQFSPQGGWVLWVRNRVAALSIAREDRAETRRRTALEEAVGSGAAAAGDTNGYEQNPSMTTARSRSERRGMERELEGAGRHGHN